MANIVLNNLSIDFPIYGVNAKSLRRQLLRLSTGGVFLRDDEKVITIRALDSVNLHCRSGDRIGLLGHNGAGKSSFLRVLAGIYEPTAGSIQVEGRVTALLDVMVGMDEDASGFENIIMCGILRGLTHQQIVLKQPEIAAFTELGDFLEMPIRTYSAGMKLRLAFGIATAFEPQILLIDEVIGTGDVNFFKKAKARISHMIARADIVVIASHELDIIRELCNKILILDTGKVRYFGDVQTGIESYQAELA